MLLGTRTCTPGSADASPAAASAASAAAAACCCAPGPCKEPIFIHYFYYFYIMIYCGRQIGLASLRQRPAAAHQGPVCVGVSVKREKPG